MGHFSCYILYIYLKSLDSSILTGVMYENFTQISTTYATTLCPKFALLQFIEA